MGHIWKKCVTLRKIGHTVQNGSHLENGPHCEKWVTLRNIGHTVKTGTNLEKNRPHLEKWVSV